MAENPKFSKIFKIKSKELLNLYENSAKLWSFLNSYEEITYGIKYGANEKKLRLFNKELDTYRKNISNLIITATKAKSIKKVSDCIEILNADCKNCCKLLKEIASSKKDMVKDTDTNIKYEDILQFEEDLNKLGVNIGKQVDLLQNKTERLKKFMENYKKENSRTNKTLRIVKLVLSILGAFFGVSSALSGTIKNLATL